jgi:hypothetical protein
MLFLLTTHLMKTTLLTVLFVSRICSAYAQHFELDTTFIITSADTTFRGISGIEYVPEKGWFFVSDRGGSATAINQGIVFMADASFLTNSGGKKTKSTFISPYSFEAIRYSRQHEMFLMSWENNSSTGLASLYDMAQVPASPWPLLNGELSIANPSDNKGIEAIAITPSGQLWVAPEAGWQNEVTTPGDTVHFHQYESQKKGNSQKKTLFAYKKDTYPGAHFKADKAGGISDMVAMDDSTLLVLERGYHVYQERAEKGRERRVENVLAKLYKVHIDTRRHILTKEVAFDFTNPAQFRDTLCNIEGICWGPSTGEKRRLYLIADDNFNNTATQRTQFIILQEKK